MLLCKQPGDTGVFATATHSNVSIYRFSSLSQLLRETTAAAGDAVQTETNTAGYEWESETAASPTASFSACTTRRRWGRPINASCVISLAQLCDAEACSVVADGARRSGQFYMSRLQPKPNNERSGAGDHHANVPLTLSLNCAQGDSMRFLYSGGGLGAWIGAEKSLSALYTTSGCGTSYDSTYLHDEADIVASGWDPLNPAALAIGRRSGVVQLLNIENSNGMVSSSLHPMNTAVTATIDASSRSSSSSSQTQFGASHMYPGASTHNVERPSVYALSVNVVQERPLKGALTSLDWAPYSHTTVVAAERSDGNGHCVEVMDLRSPDNGIRYLGMPFETTSSPSSMHEFGAGSSVPAVCYAEFVACDPSGTYVATVGSQGRRDVVQLWDLRTTSQFVCQQPYPRAGYTSLHWSTHEIPTVIATTQDGGLRLHVFGGVRSDIDDDGEEEGGMSGRGSSRIIGHSFGTPFSSSSSRRTSKPFEERVLLQPRVPAAGVGWISKCRSHSRGLVDAVGKENGVEKQGEKRVHNGPSSSRVESGSQTDIPCLLLLNAKTGELYPQVFFPVGCKVTMLGDFPLCSAGPSVFIMNTRGLFGQQLEGNPTESERMRIVVNNNNDNNNMDGTSIYNLAEGSISTSAGMMGVGATGACSLGITHVDRCLRRLDRLRAGFLPQSEKVFSVLLKEQCDREAYVLFRYGWYMQRYLFPGKTAMPVPDVIPGLLELLQREQSGGSSTAMESAGKVSNLLLRAMGWVIDQREEQMMCTLPGDDDDESVMNTVKKVAGRQVVSSGVNVAKSHQSQQQQQQHSREKSSVVSPNSCSHVSAVDESADATGFFSTMSQQDAASSLPASLDPVDFIEMASLQEAVERRTAIFVCMYRLNEASALLLNYQYLHPLYSVFAVVLLSAANQNGVPPTLTVDISTCSFWMGLCFSFLRTFRTPTASFAAQEQRGNDYNVSRGGNNNDGDIGNLYRFPLSTRREYFVSLTQYFPQIPQSDRIALAALLLLDPSSSPTTSPCDESFNAFSEVLQEMLQQQFDTNVAAGGCSLLLAAAVEGLGGNCISLQRYVDETGDVQTPVVYVALYGPGKSVSWRFWNDAYRSQLNAEGHAILRSLHDLSCKKLARLREQQSGMSIKHGTAAPPKPPLGRLDGFSSPPVVLMGVPFGELAADAKAKTKPKRTNKRTVELRCKCGKIVETTPMESSAAAPMIGRRQQSLCGSPNCLTPMCAVCGERMFALVSGYDVDTSYTWCTVCLHGGHWSHLRDWFAKHKTCPAEDCPCRCYCPPLSP